MPQKQCSDCRDGEHDNYDDDVRITIVRDPDTGHMIKRAYLCAEHREMYAADGCKLDVK